MSMAFFYGSFFMALFFMALLFLSAPEGRVRGCSAIFRSRAKGVLLFSSSFAPPPFFFFLFPLLIRASDLNSFKFFAFMTDK